MLYVYVEWTPKGMQVLPILGYYVMQRSHVTESGNV
jgi:hypothetical protein